MYMMNWDSFKDKAKDKNEWANGISVTIAILQIVLMVLGRDDK